jgi:hypothetical protein
MAHITLRLSSTWSETLLHRLDMVLDRIEHAARRFLADNSGEFRKAAQDARIRRLAAHGSSGQALM